MDFYEIVIKPDSAFGTPLSGDTLFGHFCWQAAHDPALLKQDLDQAIREYPHTPFAVFSSAWPKSPDKDSLCYVKRPDIPLSQFMATDKHQSKKDRIREAKELKSNKWITVHPDMRITATQEHLVSGSTLADRCTGDPTLAFEDIETPANQTRNTIHRLTGTTGTGRFAPFEVQKTVYAPGVLLSIFILIDTLFCDIEGIEQGLSRVGQFGFGKDATTGMGRFTVDAINALPLPDLASADGLYTLAPCLPASDLFIHRFFNPLVRFGKHGDVLARSGRPFKAPVIMAAQGAVLIPKQPPQKPYVGQAVTNVSKAMPQTVVQAYAPVFPITLRGHHDINTL